MVGGFVDGVARAAGGEEGEDGEDEGEGCC